MCDLPCGMWFLFQLSLVSLFSHHCTYTNKPITKDKTTKLYWPKRCRLKLRLLYNSCKRLILLRVHTWTKRPKKKFHKIGDCDTHIIPENEFGLRGPGVRSGVRDCIQFHVVLIHLTGPFTLNPTSCSAMLSLQSQRLGKMLNWCSLSQVDWQPVIRLNQRASRTENRPLLSVQWLPCLFILPWTINLQYIQSDMFPNGQLSQPNWITHTKTIAYQF